MQTSLRTEFILAKQLDSFDGTTIHKYRRRTKKTYNHNNDIKVVIGTV